MSVEELKNAIRGGIEANGRSLSTMEKVATDIANAATLARHTLHDSNHSDVTMGLDSLAAAVRELGPTIERLRDSREHAQKFVAEI